MSRRGVKFYIADIKDAIRKIEKYTKELTRKRFETDEQVVDAVVRNLGIIGEAVNNLPTDFKSKYPKIPWNKIVGMRNKVLHEYFGIDWGILWETIEKSIPELKKQITKIIKEL